MSYLCPKLSSPFACVHQVAKELSPRGGLESILSGCITAWYGNCSALNRKALQRVVRSAQRITGGKLPALQDTYTTRCYRKAIKIIKDMNHCLFTPLSSRRRGQYRCIKAGTERLKNCFYLKAIPVK